MYEVAVSIDPWLVIAALIVMAVRQLPRLIRDLKGPLPDVREAPNDAQPMALILPNDDGLFTWSLRLPEEPPADARKS